MASGEDGGGALMKKVVVLGRQDVGKTSLILRCVEGSFKSGLKSTIGASFFTHKITIGGRRLKLQIWDTAGQERFRSMAPMYYRGAAAAVLVYDITSKVSFSEVDSWFAELKERADPDLVFCVVGNKVDLRNNDSVSYEEGHEYAKEKLKAIFFETSAKDGTKVADVFLEIAKKLLQKEPNPTRKEGNVKLSAPETPKKCCN
eukprot:m.169838 g.169838  ORF g.169838 m.169838 type:complete len:202 (-) comp15329_c0_seq1:143-748(-)